MFAEAISEGRVTILAGAPEQVSSTEPGRSVEIVTGWVPYGAAYDSEAPCPIAAEVNRLAGAGLTCFEPGVPADPRPPVGSRWRGYGSVCVVTGHQAGRGWQWITEQHLGEEPSSHTFTVAELESFGWTRLPGAAPVTYALTSLEAWRIDVPSPTCRSCHASPCEYSCAKGGWARYQAEKRATEETRAGREEQARCRDASERAYSATMIDSNREYVESRGGANAIARELATKRRDHALAREASAAAERPFRWVVR